MTKRDFTSFLAKKMGLPLSYAEKVLNAVLDSMEDGLFRDGRVMLAGIGSFEVREAPSRRGRNPATGEEIQIPATKTVRFRPAKAIKDFLD